MTDNEKNARDFAEQFNPPLPVTQTMRINGVPFADAWQVCHRQKVRGVGIVAVFYSGQCHTYLEATGSGSLAKDAGQVFATALGLLPDSGEAVSNGTA